MEGSQKLTTQLYHSWQQAVLDNKLINNFHAPEDDPDDRWLKGDIVSFGIRCHNGRHVYYAQNQTQGQKIHSTVEEKNIEALDFVCQFNGYRSLRPGGQWKPVGRQPAISEAPDKCRFFCQDSSHSLSLLNRTPLLQVKLPHFTWRAYYNAAPIDPDGHFLWIPTVSGSPSSALHHFPQRLSQTMLDDALRLFKTLDHTILLFNSMHAGASVNHVHFQAIRHSQPLVAEKCSLIEKNGCTLLDGYPAQVMVFDRETDSHQLFRWIDQFQNRHVPFNLMMLGQRILLVPRNIEHEIVSEFPGNSLAALGLCGKIITVSYSAYLNANRENIQSALQKITLGVALS